MNQKGESEVMAVREVKQKKCKYCGGKYTPRTLLQKNCFKSECISKFYEENKSKIERTTTKRNKERKKALKESLLTITAFRNQVKTIFQKYIRLRDKDLPCISCGKLDCADWAGGHYFPAGVYSGLIFDERNVHKQCNSYCNMFKGGNLINYREGLIKRFGLEYVLQLESEADQKRVYKYTREELESIKSYYQGLIKNM